MQMRAFAMHSKPTSFDGERMISDGARKAYLRSANQVKDNYFLSI